MLALTSCTRAEILNSTIPTEGYTVNRDIAYGKLPRQKLDVYIPDMLDGPKPVIVFFYGGSWKDGNKRDYEFVGEAFANRGYIVVISDYRLYPEVRYPVFLEDAAAAFLWTHKHIADYAGDNDRIYVAGHSAGAYIAIMLAVNDRYINAAGGDPRWIRGAIGLAGPYDFKPSQEADVRDVFAGNSDASTQPITYVKRGLPPILLLTGSADEDVYPGNTQRMAASLRNMGDDVTERSYPGVAHIGVALALASGFRFKAPVLDDIDSFIRASSQ